MDYRKAEIQLLKSRAEDVMRRVRIMHPDREVTIVDSDGIRPAWVSSKRPDGRWTSIAIDGFCKLDVAAASLIAA